jgi:hypothetical protein
VFDASHYHSYISKLDNSIKVLKPPSDLKRYNNVVIRYWDEGNIGKGWSEDNVVEHMRFLSQCPEDRLVFCFKDVKDKFAKEEEKLLTWGMHAGVNEWRDTENIVALGVLRLSNGITKSDMALTVNDLRIDLSRGQVCADEEQMLTLYQAISRGTMRKAHWEGGRLQADPCNVWVAGTLEGPMRDFLRNVMRGVQIIPMHLEEPLSKAATWLSEHPKEKLRLADLFNAIGLPTSAEWRYAKERLVEAITDRGEWYQPPKSRSLVPVMS